MQEEYVRTAHWVALIVSEGHQISACPVELQDFTNLTLRNALFRARPKITIQILPRENVCPAMDSALSALDR